MNAFDFYGKNQRAYYLLLKLVDHKEEPKRGKCHESLFNILKERL